MWCIENTDLPIIRNAGFPTDLISAGFAPDPGVASLADGVSAMIDVAAMLSSRNSNFDHVRASLAPLQVVQIMKNDITVHSSTS